MDKADSRTERQVRVRNKDIIILSRVLYAMQDVSTTEQKRAWQQDRLWNITQKITGMPSGRGEPSGLDHTFAAISEIEERYIQDGNRCRNLHTSNRHQSDSQNARLDPQHAQDCHHA